MKNLCISLMAIIFLSACGSAPVKEAPAKQITETEIQTNTENNITTDENIENKEYALNTEASKILWKGVTPVKSHEGTLGIESGKIVLNGEEITGKFVIDMNQMEVTDLTGKSAQGLVDHLKNEDFFNVPQFSMSTFVITNSEKKGNAYTVTGDLTIKDITNPITFDMEINSQGQNKLSANAAFEIDRTLWDVQYSSGKFFQNLGDKIINDNMEIQLDLSFE